jgi:hypothetical protein
MSGLEVVAAVAAVISAFHGGSELLKAIKAKRRKSREGQQEFEVKQLQDSFVSGEQQISLRYEQDRREFGDLMRIGDGMFYSTPVHYYQLTMDHYYSHSMEPASTHHDHDAEAGHREPRNCRATRKRRPESDRVTRSYHHEQKGDFRYTGSVETKTASKEANASSTTKHIHRFLNESPLVHDRNEHFRSVESHKR